MRTLFVLCFVFLLGALPAFAMELQEAKDAGKVGEKLDGYIGAVQSDAETAKLVAEVNAKRREAYQQIASKNSLKMEQVQKMAAQKAINLTPSGQFVESAPGTWTKK